MAELALIATVAGTALDAGGTILSGRAESKQLKSQARQLEAMAGNTRGTAQRSAREERRQAKLASSRALAVAAASGGGATDPTVVNIMADLEAEGEYRALAQMYEGEEMARSQQAEALARRKEAKNVKRASYMKAGSTILSSAAKAFA